MSYCIYYKQADQQLNFEKEEHIIPAGLGGIEKLKKGTVSDEVNMKFSKLETVVLRNTFIGLNRRNNGPGKRGNLSVKKLRTPVMYVLKQEESPIDFLLGFIFSGESYIIPQVIIEYDFKRSTISINYMSMVLENEPIGNFPLDFDKELIKFLNDKKLSWKLVNSPYKTDKNLINIGCYRNKWYATSSLGDINKDILATDILPNLVEKVLEFSGSKELPQPRVLNKISMKYEDILNTDAATFYFIYLKTAFNALALFKGSEFVCNEIFDEVRECIVNVSNLDKFIETDTAAQYLEIEMYAKKVPEKAHYVIIHAKDSRVTAYVSFYGEKPGKLILTDRYQGEDFEDGLICNWKNREEFRLKDLQI